MLVHFVFHGLFIATLGPPRSVPLGFSMITSYAFVPSLGTFVVLPGVQVASCSTLAFSLVILLRFLFGRSVRLMRCRFFPVVFCFVSIFIELVAFYMSFHRLCRCGVFDG